jgi:hypothetical protein
MDRDQMDTRHDTATDEHPNQAPEPEGAPLTGPAGSGGPAGPPASAGPAEGSAPRASVTVTVVLVLALWVVIVLVLAIGQIILNRSLGIDLAFGSLPGIWDWVVGFALFMVTWALVRRRHPKNG